MATVTVDQAKLVLNAFAAIFQNNLISTPLVSWNQYTGEMNDRDKLTVVEQVVPRYNVTQTVNGVNDLTSGVQDTAFGSEQFIINRVFGASMGWGDFVRIRDIGDARESQALKGAAMNLAEQIDFYIMNFTGNIANNHTGTPDKQVSLYNDVATAYTRLKEEGVTDEDLSAVLTYGDKQALGNAIVYPAPANTSAGNLNDIGGTTYREGFTGQIAGIKSLFTQQLSNYTAGTRTNGAVVAGQAAVSYASVADSPAPGQYLTQTLNINGLGAGATIEDGATFTLGTLGTTSGVGLQIRAWDNRAQQVINRLQQFRVVGAVTADGTGAASVRIFPALIVPTPGGSTIGTTGQNTAHATVDAFPVLAATLTWTVAPGVTHKPRFIAQKEAVIVNTADLIMPATGIGSRKQLTKLPLSVRMWQNSDFNTGNHSIRFDVALTANVRDRRRAVKFNGI